MKKHILGLMVFGVIFSSFTYLLISNNKHISAKKVNYRFEETYTGCDTKNKQIIKQVVLDKQDSVINIKFCHQPANTAATLYFFAKDEKETRFLQRIVTQIESEKTILANILGDISETDNLYVIPELFYEGSNVKDKIPQFDEKIATSVLIFHKN